MLEEWIWRRGKRDWAFAVFVVSIWFGGSQDNSSLGEGTKMGNWSRRTNKSHSDYLELPWKGVIGSKQWIQVDDEPIRKDPFHQRNEHLQQRVWNSILRLQTLYKSVYITNGTEEIGGRAFKGLSKLESVSILLSVVPIGVIPFLDCPLLWSICVSPINQAFASEDGILLGKDRAILISCPPSRSGCCRVPYGVVEIGERAFFGCKLLKSVVLSRIVRRKGTSAFENCSGLTSVVFNDNLMLSEWIYKTSTCKYGWSLENWWICIR